MTISFLFWLIYIIALVFGGLGIDRTNQWRTGGSITFFLLIGILGYAQFGWPIK